MQGRDAGMHCDGQGHFALAEGDRVHASPAPRSARASCTRKATTTSRRCAKSCTGARRRSSSPACASLDASDAALARDPQLRRRCRARRRVRRRPHRAHRRDRRRQVDPARRDSASCSATASRCGSCAPAPSAPSSRPASTSPDARRRARGSPSRRWPPTATKCCCGACSTRRASSRAWINGSAATLAQLKELGEMLVAIHGQHAHQSLGQPETQRASSTRSADSRRSRAKSPSAGARGARRSSAGRGGQRGRSHRVRARIPRRSAARARGPRGDRRRMARARRPSQSRLAHAAELIALASDGVAALSEADDAHHRAARRTSCSGCAPR